MTTTIEILDTIQLDHSGGQGHCWRAADPPVTIREEIAAEITDGCGETCDDYTATNGQHYRWGRN